MKAAIFCDGVHGHALRRTQLLVIMACLGLFTGCQNSQLEAENARLRSQLEQADERVRVATEQLQTANDQVTTSQELLAKTKSEVAAMEKRLEEQRAAADERLLQMTKTAEAAQSQLAAANQRLEEIRKANEEENKPLSPIGIWSLSKLGEEFRLRFYEDGQVRVQKFEDGKWKKNETWWIDPRTPIGATGKSVSNIRTFLSEEGLQWQSRGQNLFSIGLNGRSYGAVNLTSENDGTIFVTDERAKGDNVSSIPPGRHENWPTDQFGKRIAAPLKKVDADWKPK